MSDTTEQSLTLETITSQLAKFEPDRVDELIAAAQAHANSIVADVSTRKGRELRKSEAYKISQTKVRVINLIDESIEDAKKAVKVGTTAKAKIIDAFDATRDEIRAPALEWEANEEARKAAIRERIFEIESQTDQLSLLSVAEIDERWDEVDRLAEFDFQEAEEKATEVIEATRKRLKEALAARKQYEAEQAELKRLREAEEKRQAEEARTAELKRWIQQIREYPSRIGDLNKDQLNEARLKIEAIDVSEERFGDLAKDAFAAREYADLRVSQQITKIDEQTRKAWEEQEKQRKADEAKAAEEAKAKAEAEAKAAEEREKQRKADEAARIKAAEEAAAKRERDRLKAEADAKAEKERQAAAAAKAKRDAEELAEAKRKANEKHRRQVREEAFTAIAHLLDVTEEAACDLVTDIERGEIPHVTLNF